MTALHVQVGGHHYTDMAIQPMHFCMNNDWDSCAYLIVKYLGRYNKQDGEGPLDIAKALHSVELRALLSKQHNVPNVPLLTVISADAYCRENQFNEMQTFAMHHLERWIRYPDDAPALQSLKDSLNRLLDQHG